MCQSSLAAFKVESKLNIIAKVLVSISLGYNY